jgi:hypothetical protein
MGVEAGGSIFGCLVLELCGGRNQLIPHTDLSQNRSYMSSYPGIISWERQGKGGFDPEWSTLSPFLKERDKSVLTLADKPARIRDMCREER